ncbi:MAG: hypothetical protein AAFQ90_13835, partial [Pseudomonadota bacterium]
MQVSDAQSVFSAALAARSVRCLAVLALGFVLCLMPGVLRAETPGKDGDVTIIGNQIVNEYARLSGDASAGAMQISVTGLALNLPSLEAGDLIMIYQAQGASIRSGDNARFGEVRDLNSAGRYEFHTVKQINGNVIILHDFGGACAGLQFSYSSLGKAQVIRVPQYRTLRV